MLRKILRAPLGPRFLNLKCSYGAQFKSLCLHLSKDVCTVYTQTKHQRQRQDMNINFESECSVLPDMLFVQEMCIWPPFPNGNVKALNIQYCHSWWLFWELNTTMYGLTLVPKGRPVCLMLIPNGTFSVSQKAWCIWREWEKVGICGLGQDPSFSSLENLHKRTYVHPLEPWWSNPGIMSCIMSSVLKCCCLCLRLQQKHRAWNISLKPAWFQTKTLSANGHKCGLGLTFWHNCWLSFLMARNCVHTLHLLSRL